jgi:hypothetical protein
MIDFNKQQLDMINFAICDKFSQVYNKIQEIKKADKNGIAAMICNYPKQQKELKRELKILEEVSAIIREERKKANAK